MNYDSAKKEIIKIIRHLSPKHGIHNVFRDFVTLAACTISNSVDKRQWEKREEMYMRIIKKYDKDEANKFAEILALVITGLSSRFGDFLGELYMELEISNKNSGQFFTPYDISKMMAQFLQTRDEVLTLNEPAVGSGGMIIAYAEVMHRKELNYQTQLKVVCNDIDYDVVKMCYVQLSLLGIDAVVYQGDTITLKMNEVWYTPMHFLNKAREIRKEKSDKMISAMREIIEMTSEHPVMEPKEMVQLSLF